MSTIRRQSIISSAYIYFGFALGFLNTYLFTREGGFSDAQYGLVGTFEAIANVMFSFANLGMLAFIHKFYPYYNDNLPPDKNDMVTWALLISVIGFIMVVISGISFEKLVIRKFGANSADLVKYYHWIFPFGFGLTLYSLFEAYAWQLKKSVLTTYLREIQFRIFKFLLIILTIWGVLKSFDQFIKIFAFGYILLALILFLYLVFTNRIHLTFQPSRVTRKFFKKIFALASFVWTGNLVTNIASVFDVLVIAAVMPHGLAYAGIFTLAQYVGSLIQAPQRSIISASIAPLSKAWKDKDFEKINVIYHRSSINQLIFAAGMFVLIWINFRDGVHTFQLKKEYLEGQYVFLLLGLMRVIDMGTGVNSQIIATSTFWRFEFFTGLILLVLALPLNYILTRRLGLIGPAIATLAALSIYNGIRYWFLWRRFKMQPFTWKSLHILVLAFCGYIICYLLCGDHEGFLWILMRTTLFLIIYCFGIIYFNLSPDILPVLESIRKRFGFGEK